MTINDLNLDDPKVKEWMDKWFKAGEYCLLTLVYKDKGLTPSEQGQALAEVLNPHGFNIVILPGDTIQVMVNLSEVAKLVDTLQDSKFNALVPRGLRAMVDFESDSEGTEQ
jgi:hypothetical protein